MLEDFLQISQLGLRSGGGDGRLWFLWPSQLLLVALQTGRKML